MRRIVLLLIGGLWLSSPAVASPLDIVYANTTFSNGLAFDNGTRLLADDLTLTRAGTLDDFTFCMTFFGSPGSILTGFTADVLFFDDDGASGGPGTLLGTVAVSRTGLSFEPRFTHTITETSLGSLGIQLPNTIWAGLRFTSASGADVNTLGMTLFDPPTTGSSANIAFLEGFGIIPGRPGAPANFGWEVSQVVPEPSTWLLFGSGLATLMRSARKRRV